MRTMCGRAAGRGASGRAQLCSTSARTNSSRVARDGSLASSDADTDQVPVGPWSDRPGLPGPRGWPRARRPAVDALDAPAGRAGPAPDQPDSDQPDPDQPPSAEPASYQPASAQP